MKRTNSVFIWVLALMIMVPVFSAIAGIALPSRAKAAGVEISAVCSPESMASGGQVEVEVTVTNDTEDVLEGVGVNYLGYSATLGSIDPGDSTYDEGMVELGDSQLGQDITINVTYTRGGLAETKQTTVRVQKEQSNTPPNVTFTRSASTKQAAPGEKVTLTYEVRNNSSDAITNVSISDAAASGIASGDSIDAGASKKYTASVTVNNDISSQPKLTYTYNGQDYDKTLDVLTVAVAKASLSVSATADKTNVNKGESVNFTIKLNNTGSTKISNIKLVDDKGEVIRSSATVNAGASPSVTHSIAFDQTRSVVFTATYPSGSETATAMSDPIEVKVEGTEPQGQGKLSITTVSTDPAEPMFPADVTVKVTVTNDGEVTLTNVLINEAKLGRVGTVSELLPGASKEVSKQTRLTEDTDFSFTATASDDGGNSYESGVKSLSVAGTVAPTETTLTPTISMTPSPTPRPASDGLKTMVIAIIVIVVLIVVAAIALIVLMVQERRAKKLAEEEEGEDDDPDNPDDDKPINKDNPQQVDGALPPRRRPEGEQKRRPDGEPPRRRPEGEPKRRPEDQRRADDQRRPDEQRRRPEGEQPPRRRPQPNEELERTQAIPPQYRNGGLSEDTQEIPSSLDYDSDYAEDDYIEERPRRKRRQDEYYEEERPRRRREDYDEYDDDYEERPRRKRPPEDAPRQQERRLQERSQQERRQQKPRRQGTEDDLNYGPPPKRRKKKHDE